MSVIPRLLDGNQSIADQNQQSIADRGRKASSISPWHWKGKNTQHQERDVASTPPNHSHAGSGQRKGPSSERMSMRIRSPLTNGMRTWKSRRPRENEQEIGSSPSSLTGLSDRTPRAWLKRVLTKGFRPRDSRIPNQSGAFSQEETILLTSPIAQTPSPNAGEARSGIFGKLSRRRRRQAKLGQSSKSRNEGRDHEVMEQMTEKQAEEGAKTSHQEGSPMSAQPISPKLFNPETSTTTNILPTDETPANPTDPSWTSSVQKLITPFRGHTFSGNPKANVSQPSTDINNNTMSSIPAHSSLPAIFHKTSSMERDEPTASTFSLRFRKFKDSESDHESPWGVKMDSLTLKSPEPSSSVRNTFRISELAAVIRGRGRDVQELSSGEYDDREGMDDDTLHRDGIEDGVEESNPDTETDPVVMCHDEFVEFTTSRSPEKASISSLIRMSLARF